ncbi:hypothetical protein GW796_08700 [archaeon]|nr:hypothetical protein [archaeon]NCQ51957.1 hypothetical protein [archaeon]
MVWTDINNIGINVAEKIMLGQSIILVGNISVTGSRNFYEYLDNNFSIESEFSSNSFTGNSESSFIVKKLSTPNLQESFFVNKYLAGRPKFKFC